MVRSMLSESLRSVILEAVKACRRWSWLVMKSMATPAIRNLIREDKVAQVFDYSNGRGTRYADHGAKCEAADGSRLG